MRNKDRKERKSIWPPFKKSAIAGIVALVFGFLVSLGGFAPFPPGSAIERFFAIVPASIQEPGVQTFGALAKYLALLVAVAISIIIYGILGVPFERYFVPRLARRSFSRFEKFLLYSVVTWLLFDGVVLTIAGQGPFGIFGSTTGGFSPLFFPLTLLLGQGVYAAFLSWQYSGSLVFASSKPERNYMIPGTNIPNKKIREQTYSRREIIEKGALTLGALSLLALSFPKALSVLASEAGPAQILPGSSYNLQNAPQIFEDPRVIALVNSEVTANGSFYKVTINLFDPGVDPTTWNLQLAGLVASAKNYTLNDIQNLPSAEQYTTFECVSNQVNGNLISNAKWTGVRFSDLFNDAGGVSPSAKYVVFYSVDGYSVGVPLEKAMMSDSIIAYKMNDATLPQGHGFPLRAVIPGLYGMMSAKWIRKIELVDSVYSGYWQTRGWTNVATIETLAFISIPGANETISLAKYNGSVILGGVAFAGDRGISKVEVSVDGGKTWQTAELKPPISQLTWVLWAYDWHPSSSGRYDVYVRATDGTGAVQTAAQNGSFPNGATGYATIPVSVVS